MIKGTIQGQGLFIETPVIVADTINYITAEFIFRTSDWNGLVKIAHFSNGKHSADVELVDNRISASEGLNLSEGVWSVSLTGHRYNGEELTQRITTTTAKFRVKPYAVSEGEAIESLPSYGEKILGKVRGIENNVNSMALAVAELNDSIRDLKKASSFVTPEMYGAVGDGIANDFSAFHEALYSGHPVYLANTYMLSATTYDHSSSFTYIDILPDGAYLFGPGIIKFPDNAKAIAAEHDPNRGLNLFYVNGSVTIRDITIDMNGANNLVKNGDTKAYMYAFYGIFDNCYFENVTIKNSAGRNMLFLRDGAHNRFVGCHLFVGGTTLPGNQYQTDFSFVYCDARYTDFIECEIDGGYPPLTSCGGVEIHRDHCKLINCSIQNVKICVVLCMSDNRQGAEAPLDDIVIKGNSLIGTRCIQFWHTAYPYADIIITNNNLHFINMDGIDTTIHGIISSTSSGEALNVKHLVFSGNNVHTDDTTESYSVYLKNVTNGIISGNVIDTPGGGIYAGGNNVLISGNTVKHGVENRSIITSGDNVIAQNNMVIFSA